MQSSYMKIFGNLFFNVEKNNEVKDIIEQASSVWIQLSSNLEKLKMK